MVVVVKIGTSSITDKRGIIRVEALAKLCAEVATLRQRGDRVVIVTSGAIAAGLPVLGFDDSAPTDMATLQAVSAVGQSRLLRVYDDVLAGHGLIGGQVLLAPLDFVHRKQYLHARQTLSRLLELGVVPVVNENDAIADDEIRFGDNDRLAALVAHLVSAEILVLLTDMPGVLTADPRFDEQASLIEEIIDRRSFPRGHGGRSGERAGQRGHGLQVGGGQDRSLVGRAGGHRRRGATRRTGGCGRWSQRRRDGDPSESPSTPGSQALDRLCHRGQRDGDR